MDRASERRSLIALHLTPGLGPVRIARLLERFGSAAAAWSAPQEALAGLPRIGPGEAAAIVGARPRVDVDAELRRAEACGTCLLTWLDAAYPAALRALRDAPPVIYIRGPWREGPAPVVAVVGTRRASAYGLGIAGAIGEILGGAGVVVVSGLARGIDKAVHAGVLRGGGTTVGVLGCGVDVVYPAEHRLLMEAMRQRGAVIAEVPMGTRPRKQQFPRRNRLISGLARAVVVVEGDVDSGALITARYGLAQGRQVLAVPGSVHARASRGPHRLLAQGARILAAPSDLFDALGLQQAIEASGPGGPRRDTDEAPLRPAGAGVLVEAERRGGGGPESRVLAAFDALEDQALHIDTVIARTGLPPAEATATLAALEVRGLLRQLPGNRFARCRHPRGRGDGDSFS